ncbi:SAF domain-containing protein [Streptomyces sp. 4N509B]|uniref:SAF domain-containing protein n=1 Tax=Streptomyces sp. 4N509B TaxID=3457413 RepID=UPI003FD28B95
MTSAVAFAVVASSLGEREAVLAVARDLPAGHEIAAGDLREVQVAADAGVVPADQVGSVVGQVSAVPLAGGSLLAPGQVSDAAEFPPQGHSEVAFSVEAGDAPPLERGQRLAVFDAATEAAPVVKDDDGVTPVVGTVTGVAEDEAAVGGGGPVVVTVMVESAAAQRAAGVRHPRVVVLSQDGGGSR